MTNFAGKAGKCLAISAAMTVLLAVSAMAAEDNIAVAVGATTGSSLRLRAEASTSSSIVTTLDKGVAVAVLDNTVEGWYKINYAGKVGYVSADYMVIDQDNVFDSYGRVNTSGVNVRAEANTSSSVVTTLGTDALVNVKGIADGWYRIAFENGTEGYIRSDFVNLTKTAEAAPAASAANSSIADYAKKFQGVKYVYGGASPKGFDCSGFTMYVMKQFGVNLPHSATSQWQSGIGTRVYSTRSLESGDLVFFNDPSRNAGKACSHAGIYIGNGKFIHASSSRSGGVIISDITSGYYYNYFVGGIRI